MRKKIKALGFKTIGRAKTVIVITIMINFIQAFANVVIITADKAMAIMVTIILWL